MATLILDTSTWLDLAKPRVEEILVELERQVEQGITILLTCDIIVDEWERNKHRVLEEVITSIRSHAKSALKMAALLSDDDKKQLEVIIEKYTSVQDEQEKLAEKFFDRVENLLKSSETFRIQDSLKVEMANRALTKQVPFHNRKNNMADALLYFGAVSHVQETRQIATDLIFVTSNFKEFSDPNNLKKLHADLYEWNVHFFNNLALALTMRTEEIDLMDELHECQLLDWLEWEEEKARGK